MVTVTMVLWLVAPDLVPIPTRQHLGCHVNGTLLDRISRPQSVELREIREMLNLCNGAQRVRDSIRDLRTGFAGAFGSL